MPLNDRDSLRYRRDVQAKGDHLTAQERAKIITSYLPAPPTTSNSYTQSTHTVAKSTPQPPSYNLTHHRRRIRPFLKTKIHSLLFFLIHLFFGIYIRLRQIYHAVFDRLLAILYYHHRTPEYIRRDVKDLSRLPEHLSVILTLRSEEDGGLEALIDEVSDLCAWTCAVGVPQLSVYERTGVLKGYMENVYELVGLKLVSYFGPVPQTPGLRVHAPNLPTISGKVQMVNGVGAVSPPSTQQHVVRPHLDLLLLSSTDGRDTLVDLTRTLTEMAQSSKLSPKDITSDLINTEISATTSISPPTPPHSPALRPSRQTTIQKQQGKDSDIGPGEPDLLIVFAPIVKLDGYPPWQIRLTEIFCVGDSGGDVSGRSATRVEYQGFLRGLWRYAGAQMRFGR